ncbi:MAG: single-stranded-DNA-specific exonuclease RecJ [Candidatus Paraimprobicoccus trichonymphae]|uniref:Single-stranded-DNA-specific exonuclease RecJ n=1 Tax=Candidatus Paraimprobicoccus trichonymphae TaxID=3033793 RepID=A0AA48I4F0_9FIRM|nr:MAG: single-stranded-DNA-specific exonuclease RecJ [Candidatus Paraimprobicoccus trichonymphae]
MSIYEWLLPGNLDEFKIKKISSKNNISEILARLLIVRKLVNKNEIENFLSKKTEFSDPYDFKDMKKLVKRVKKAIKNSEKICIFGDYDADGITATVLMYSYLKSKNANVIYHIPTRNDGYGLSKTKIDFLKNQNVNLIFTVDNGITANEEVKYAKELKIETVITDHHKINGEIPQAVAIVNPYRTDCKSKFKNYAGVGVAFKAICALDENKNINVLLKKYSDLVTMGTIGDSIELKNESRDIVKFGLKQILKSEKPGMKVLLGNIRLEGASELSTVNVSFDIIPKINATGRIDTPELAVELLLCEDLEHAQKIYSEINSLNLTRKKIEKNILMQIEEEIENNKNRFEKVIFSHGNNWHQGVIGIVANRITRKYGKPCFLISYETGNDTARGSCRSIGDFSVHDILTKCSEYLERFGGHTMAAGMDLKKENLDNFKNLLFDNISEFDIPFPTLKIDMKLDISDINRTITDEIDKLKPFGVGNPEPVFYVPNVILTNIIEVGAGKHLRLIFKDENDNSINTVYFQKSSGKFLYKTGEKLDIAVTIKENNYFNNYDVSLYITDLKSSNTNTHEILMEKRKYENFKLNNIIKDKICVDKNDLILIYNYLKKNYKYNQRVDLILNRIKWKEPDVFKLHLILDIFEELKIIDICWNSYEFKVKINKLEQKALLSNSKILDKLNLNIA